MSNEAPHPTTSSKPLVWSGVVLATAATIYFLHWAASAIVPLVFASFLIAVVWPFYRWLAGRLPGGLGAIACALLLLGVVGAIGWGLGFSADYVAQQNQISDYRDRIEDLRGKVSNIGAQFGMKEEQLSSNSLKKAMKRLISPVQGFLVGGTLTVAFFALGLMEVSDFGRRVRKHFPDGYEQFVRVVGNVAKNFQRYLIVRTGIGLLTGALVTGGAYLIGLDLALIWGLVNFLLNYIPTLGSILGVVPPTLFALVQFENIQMVLLTFAVVGGIQLLMGNYIDPLAQGKYLQLSPVVILFAVTFWGFVWGIAGALLAVPITLLIALVLREFPSTRFLGALLLSPEDEKEAVSPPDTTKKQVAGRRSATKQLHHNGNEDAQDQACRQGRP